MATRNIRTCVQVQVVYCASMIYVYILVLAYYSCTCINLLCTTGTAFFRGPVHCLQHIIRERGITGLYKGTQIQFLRDLPASGSYFLIYEFLKNTLEHHNRSLQMLVEFISGGTAGVLSWMIIMPFDVVKSRLQADVSGTRYSGLLQCFRHIVATEGFPALFTGARVTAIRAFPVNAFTFLVYSEVMTGFRGRTTVSIEQD